MGVEEEVYPLMCVLPMWWSRCPLVAQAAHEELLGRDSSVQESSRSWESKP